jgi:hypothetical protein
MRFILFLGGAMVFDGKLNGDKIIGTFTQDSAKGDSFCAAPCLRFCRTKLWMSAFATARSPS